MFKQTFRGIFEAKISSKPPRTKTFTAKRPFAGAVTKAEFTPARIFWNEADWLAQLVRLRSLSFPNHCSITYCFYRWLRSFRGTQGSWLSSQSRVNFEADTQRSWVSGSTGSLVWSTDPGLLVSGSTDPAFLGFWVS